MKRYGNDEFILGQKSKKSEKQEKVNVVSITRRLKLDYIFVCLTKTDLCSAIIIINVTRKK